jgi:hypothetical protein
MTALAGKTKLPNIQAAQSEERYQIYSLTNDKKTLTQLAQALGRSCSMISRDSIEAGCQNESQL